MTASTIVRTCRSANARAAIGRNFPGREGSALFKEADKIPKDQRLAENHCPK